MTADERFDRIDQAIEAISQRFDRVDERFDRIERSIEALTQHFDRVDQRFDRVDQRFDRIDRSIETLTQRGDRIERSIETLTQYVLDFRQETAIRFQTIETRLDVPSATVASIDSRLPALTKAILDFGTISSQLEREHWRQKDAATSLVARVEKLEEAISRIVEPAA